VGQFSWISQNTNEAILESDSRKKAGLNQTVVMVDNNNNYYIEKDYQGYGVFGDKDFYSLLAEMNGQGSERIDGIDISFSGKTYLSPNLYILTPGKNPEDFKWSDTKPKDDPNQGWYYNDEDEDYGYDDDEDEDEDKDEDDECSGCTNCTCGKRG